MKNYCLFLIISVFLLSCGEDDNNDKINTCTQAEWLGTYAGTEDCNGTTDDATVAITASGDSIIMAISNPSSTVTTPAIAIDNCTISESVDLGGTFPLELDVSLDTDELTIITNFAGSQCTYTVIRM